jgi:hypothetical protein
VALAASSMKGEEDLIEYSTETLLLFTVAVIIYME